MPIFRVQEETRDLATCEDVKQNHGQVKRSRRCYSAPPFHRQKRMFNSLSHLQMVDRKKSDAELNLDALTFPGSFLLAYSL